MAARTGILIGSGAFAPDTGLASLEGPANDVCRLAAVLERPDLGGFSVQSCVDAESHALQRTLERTLNLAERDDLILIYYSGHGKLDSRGQLCLAAANTSLDMLRSTSVPVSFLKSLIDDCRSNCVVLLLDCCFSGAAGKSFTGLRGTVDDQLAVAQGAGVHILTSSTAIETSQEREHDGEGTVLGNFTRCVIDGITSGRADVDNDGRVTLGDLHSYLGRSMRGQSPRYWGFEASGEIVIAHNSQIQEASLPAELLSVLTSPLAAVREGAVVELSRFLTGRHAGRALAARRALQTLADDDSRRVAEAAKRVLGELPIESPAAATAADVAGTRLSHAHQPEPSQSPFAAHVDKALARADQSPEARTVEKPATPAVVAGGALAADTASDATGADSSADSETLEAGDRPRSFPIAAVAFTLLALGCLATQLAGLGSQTLLSPVAAVIVTVAIGAIPLAQKSALPKYRRLILAAFAAFLISDVVFAGGYALFLQESSDYSLLQRASAAATVVNFCAYMLCTAAFVTRGAFRVSGLLVVYAIACVGIVSLQRSALDWRQGLIAAAYFALAWTAAERWRREPGPSSALAGCGGALLVGSQTLPLFDVPGLTVPARVVAVTAALWLIALSVREDIVHQSADVADPARRSRAGGRGSPPACDRGRPAS